MDIEASFVNQDDVLEFVSRAVLDAAEMATGERPGEIGTISWAEALDTVRHRQARPAIRHDPLGSLARSLRTAR